MTPEGPYGTEMLMSPANSCDAGIEPVNQKPWGANHGSQGLTL